MKTLFVAAILSAIASLSAAEDVCTPKSTDVKSTQYKNFVVNCAGCYMEADKFIVPAKTSFTVYRISNPQALWRFSNIRSTPLLFEQAISISPRVSVVQSLEVTP